MIVYIDYIFIENLILNYLLLLQTKKLIKENTNIFRNLISSVIGSIYVCIMFLLKLEVLNYIICKILLSFVMIYITFIPKKMNKYIKEIIVFYFVLIINIGTYITIISIFNLNVNQGAIKTIIYFVGYIIVHVIDCYMWKMFKLKVKKSDLIWSVYLKNEKEFVMYRGFIDTGNNSKDINSGRPIFYANKKEGIDLANRKKINIYVHTIKGKTVMQGYEFDDVIIQNKEIIKSVDVVICFTEENIKNSLNYDMIMNYGVYEDVLGGICI